VLISPLLVVGAAVLVRVADLAVEIPEALSAWFDHVV